MKDALGREVVLPDRVRRIVSLSPATTENLFALGEERKLVGATTACDYPPEAQKITRVGDFYRPSTERILTLRPDVVVLDSNTILRADADALARRLRAPIFVFQSRRYTDVERNLATLALLVGTDFAASRARRATKHLREAIPHAKPKSAPTVFVEINEMPLYAAGPGSFVADMIALAGGRNVVTGNQPYPLMSKETLLLADPQVYVIALPTGQTTAHGFASPLNKLQAVRNKRVIALPADHLLRPTPRLALGMKVLAATLAQVQ